MAIDLVVQPRGVPLYWHEFTKGLCQGSGYRIALDGFVYGGPQFDAKGPWANFNHHEQVARLETRATCAQVLMAIRQGLFSVFRKNGEPHADVYVNDCDEDVCLSWFILKNNAICAQAVNPLLNRLVMMEDALDATAGAYPFPSDLPILRQLAWVFEPYRLFRLSGQLEKGGVRDYRAVIEDVGSRISRHIMGDSNWIPLDTTYEVIGGGNGWSMIREIGAQARTGMFANGIRAYVSVRERPDNRWNYVIGRMSPFIPLDLNALYPTLNGIEKITDNDTWGGSDMVGGSPRNRGSSLSPEELSRVINGS